jgi:hypothetical protein
MPAYPTRPAGRSERMRKSNPRSILPFRADPRPWRRLRFGNRQIVTAGRFQRDQPLVDKTMPEPQDKYRKEVLFLQPRSPYEVNSSRMTGLDSWP